MEQGSSIIVYNMFFLKERVEFLKGFLVEYNLLSCGVLSYVSCIVNFLIPKVIENYKEY